MRMPKQAGLSFVITVILWAVLSWPLASHLTTTVPDSFQSYGATYIRTMSPGDHLQFLYYLALFEDMATGHTPWFYNLYEFNTGDDAARFEPDPYYFPFSGLFTVLAMAGGWALAWNLTGLASLWLTYWATWRLVRRYTTSEWLAGCAALMTFALPFRWGNLLGGSPVGLAMLWPPLVMYGLDVAVRDQRIRGGFIAGASLLFALWTDLHVFFFAVLLVPAWCVVAFVQHRSFSWRRSSDYLALARALLPVPLLLAAALGLRHLHTTGNLAGESERSWREAAIYSPHALGLIKHLGDVEGHIYVGWAIFLLIGLGIPGLLVATLRRGSKQLDAREVGLFVLLLAGVAGVLMLALGAYGPHGGRLFDLARSHLPFYGMIRQPAKIFGILPPLLAVAATLSFGWLARFIRVPVLATGWFLLWAVILVDVNAQIGTGLTWLNTTQGAYAAVARDAAASQRRPGALVVPLWPGDTHYTSIYQIYALHYRLRMVNGYSPTVTAAYRTDIFNRFASINHGALTDEQLDDLLRRGIPYILVHEDQFPEKVSPYPIGFTLRNLMNHPRLEPLGQDERVWAFRILESPTHRAPVAADWTIFPTARRYEAERCVRSDRLLHEEPGTGQGSLVRLGAAGDEVTIDEEDMAGAPQLGWLVRARGQGVLRATAGRLEGGTSIDQSIASTNWTWYRIPTGHESGFAPCGLKLEWQSGVIDIDTMILSAGPWQSPAVGETLSWGAARFFHAGYLDFASESVTFEQMNDPNSAVFYGPKLPLEPGTYEVTIGFSSEAPPGAKLGAVNLEQDDATGAGVTVELVAGQPARGILHRTDNLPFNLAYIFLGTHDIHIQRVNITRIN